MDIIRRYKPEDFQRVLSVMVEIQPPIAGVKSKKMYKAFCEESHIDSRITMAVAESCNEVVGFAIAIANWKEFWRAFFIKHPLLFCAVLVQRLSSRMSKNTDQEIMNTFEDVDITQWLSKTELNRSWSENSSNIAKFVYLGIESSSRGKHIGRRLLLCIFSLLESKGIRRIDAWISPQNIQAIKMDYSVGWQIERCGSMLFATRDLKQKGDEIQQTGEYANNHTKTYSRQNAGS